MKIKNIYHLEDLVKYYNIPKKNLFVAILLLEIFAFENYQNFWRS